MKKYPTYPPVFHFLLALLCLQNAYAQNEVYNFQGMSTISQNPDLQLVSSHKYQLLFSEGDVYASDSTEFAKGKNDFSGFVPINGSSLNGYLVVNHEEYINGGASILDVRYNFNSGLWDVNNSRPLNLNANDLVSTARNCSGTVTSWGTVISCEEIDWPGDANADGYDDLGWCFEIDVENATIRNYGTGTQQKLWAMGRMRHENVVVANDNKTVYFGADGGNNCLFKFVADTPEDLTEGTLYVLNLNGGIDGSGNNSQSTGTWIVVPNTTQAERNTVGDVANGLGGTSFGKIEDVEINPLTGQVYFASTTFGIVYRLTDAGATINNFERFIGNETVTVSVAGGTTETYVWGPGTDNLVFDNIGNLWVCQDGGQNYTVVVGPNHTPTNHDVRIFSSAPLGAEPTGITFTPDNKFLFMSMQHPSTSNGPVLYEVGGGTISFNESKTVVIALDDWLGIDQNLENDYNGILINVLLEGLSIGSGNMNTTLFDNQILPRQQPFNTAPWNYDGNESFVYNRDITDVSCWALIELRPQSDLNTIAYQEAALVKSDGKISTTANASKLVLETLPDSENYYVYIYPYNHLPIRSNVAYPITAIFNTAWWPKISPSSVYGNLQQKQMPGNQYALFAGDFDGNAIINNLDYNIWVTDNAAVNVFRFWDVDGNGIINNLDYNLWSLNRSKVSILSAP